MVQIPGCSDTLSDFSVLCFVNPESDFSGICFEDPELRRENRVYISHKRKAINCVGERLMVCAQGGEVYHLIK